MADLAAKTTWKTAGIPKEKGSGIIADGVTVYEGMFCAQSESGYVNHWADGATDVWGGLLVGGDDRANDGVLLGETSDTPPPRARFQSGFIMVGMSGVAGQTTLTQANVGNLVYCPTSDPADMTTVGSGNTNPIGRIDAFRSTTDIDVYIFTPEEVRSQ